MWLDLVGARKGKRHTMLCWSSYSICLKGRQTVFSRNLSFLAKSEGDSNGKHSTVLKESVLNRK